MGKADKEILIDADVVSHFITGELALFLPKIFPNSKIKMLDKVYAELERWGKKAHVDNLINFKVVQVIPFPEDNIAIKKEYAYLKSTLRGDGESATMAVSKHTDYIMASSNLKDILTYCNQHLIDQLSTMDFLCRALAIGLFTEADCDTFITKVLTKSKLPVSSMKKHTCREIEFC